MESEGMENNFSCRPQKKAAVAILVSDNLDFILKAIVRDTEGHYIILKGSIQQKDLRVYPIRRSNNCKYLCL